MVYISSKSEVFDFSGWQKTPIRWLTIIEKSRNYGNLPYLVVNAYGLNFIKIGGIWIFRGGRGVEKPPIRGVICDLWCPFSNSAELFQSKVMFENLVQIGWAFQELSCPQTHPPTPTKKKKKIKITDATESNTLGKILFRQILLIITRVIMVTKKKEEKKKIKQNHRRSSI